MPGPKVPKIIHKKQKKAAKMRETFSKRDSIEDELQIIQEKLRQLNG